MKNKINILIIGIAYLATLFAQNNRYLDEVFDEVIKTENVVYGNAPDLPFLFWVESNTVDIDLDMDIYEPEGDTLTNRPVIIFAHTGAYFSGHNELDDVVDLSISAAKRGYVAISINYRLGINIISTYSGERAVYRAVQDGGAAIRYLREFPEEFGINPDQIFMWGTSAGAITALHLSYLDDDDRPEATYGGGGDPDLGCPICEGNDYVHDPKPNAIVSCWGAVGDLDWIDSTDTVPAIMFHGTLDPIIPFNSGLPFTLDIALPIVYGSNLIHDRLDEVGIANELHAESGLLHEYWGTVNGNWFGGPNEYFYQIQNDAYSFLYNYLDCGQQDPLSLCLAAEGGLNEVLLQWAPNPLAESYNISRDDQFISNIPASTPYYLDDGSFGDETGWGLAYDTEYCYTVTVVEAGGNEGTNSDEICATTLAQLQAFLDLDVSLANAEVAAVASPFGDLTGDGNVDAVIMVKMVNFFDVNGYQFNFSMDPGIVDVVVPFDGTNIQFNGCIAQAMEAGMDETVATAYCESAGYSSGLQALISSPGSSGMVMGFDINGTGYIPAGYPGDGGNEGNLLAVLVLNSQYTGSGAEVAVTISDFVVSGVNPFTGGSVTLNACDADLDPFNGCFDVDTFSTPAADCAGIPGGSAVVDECGECGGDGSPCFPDGDINSDEVVNILDVVVLVNIILGLEEENPAGDLNQDGFINVLDIILLVNIILQ
jgi:acetyl esterase/lipase